MQSLLENKGPSRNFLVAKWWEPIQGNSASGKANGSIKQNLNTGFCYCVNTLEPELTDVFTRVEEKLFLCSTGTLMEVANISNMPEARICQAIHHK